MISCKEYYERVKSDTKYFLKVEDKNPTIYIDISNMDKSYEMYINGIIKDCTEVGIKTKEINLGKDSCTGQNLNKPFTCIPFITNNKTVNAILPINNNLDIYNNNVNSPQFPAIVTGMMDYLYYNNISLQCKKCLIIGRSKNIGLPLLEALLHENATVTICHSFTPVDEIIRLCGENEFVFSCTDQVDLLDSNVFNTNSIVFDVGAIDCKDNKFKGNITIVKQEKKVHKTPYITSIKDGVNLLTRAGVLINLSHWLVR